MRKLRRILSIVLPLTVCTILLTARAAHAQSATVLIAGCYRVEVGPWNGPLAPDFHPDLADLPREIVFDTATYVVPSDPSLSRGTFAAYARTAMTEKLHLFGAWRYRPDGWVSMGPLGTSSGFSITVLPTGEDLRGSVLAFTDVVSAGIQAEVEAPVLLQRVTCSSVGPSPSSNPA